MTTLLAPVALFATLAFAALGILSAAVGVHILPPFMQTIVNVTAIISGLLLMSAGARQVATAPAMWGLALFIVGVVSGVLP